MGRILRKKRVGIEDSENLVACKSDLKSVISIKDVFVDRGTGCSLKTPKRAVLMDKTNALKPKGLASKVKAKKVGANQEDAENCKNPVVVGRKVKRVVRRRQSSKENYREPDGSPEVDTNSRPLGDKTNVPGTKSASPSRKTDENGVKPAGDKQIPDGLEDVSPIEAQRKQPSRNSTKFDDGRISAVQRSLTSEDSATEPRETSCFKAKPLVSHLETRSRSTAVEKPKRARRDKVVNSQDLNPVGKTEARVSPRSQKHLVPIPEECGLNEQDLEKSDSDSPNVETGVDDYITNDHPPLRKLPPRNAAKYEKGWISALRRPRASKDGDSPPKSPSPSKCLDKANQIRTTHNSNEVETASVHEEKTGPTGRQLSGRRNQVDCCRAEELITPMDSGCVKTSSFVSKSNPQRLKNFESRIAAKLGKDMSSSCPDKAKGSSENPEEMLPTGTSSRKLRKRGCKDKTPSPKKNLIDGSPKPVESAKPRPTTTVAPNDAAAYGVRHNRPDLGSTSESPVVPAHSVKNVTKTATSHRDKAPTFEPKPGCSRDSEFVTPLRKSTTSKSPNTLKKSPFSPAKAPSSSLFSIFKKPEALRRNSSENKIFVSTTKPRSPTSKLPVYGDPNMTPLKKTSTLPREMKEELYDFEVDENEPKPRKRHRPIMKIQRMRAAKRKKPKVFEPDRETELRVLRNLDLSPSLFEDFRAAKRMKAATSGGAVAHESQPPLPTSAADCTRDDHQDLVLDGGPMSSPCRDYGESTPMRTDEPSMFMDDCRDKFGRLSAKIYSPVKPKDSPIPVLLAEYNNDPVRRGDSSRRSVASNVSNVSGLSGASGNSIYQNDLDVSASTPVKFNKNYSSVYVRQRKKPLELNVSNCFGFDEPELMEEPLVSPIKSTLHVPIDSGPVPPPARPIPILKSKPPVMLPPQETPTVDVDQVIKQLRFEVGDNVSANNSANLSVYDDSEISLKNKSPIKRYFHPTDGTHKANAANESALDGGDESLSPIAAAPKMPRLSYERPNKLRKQKVVLPTYKESSENESASESENIDEEYPPAEMTEPVEDIFKPTKNKYVKKEVAKKKEKGMTKKEEEELEKWAEMFNSQCNKIDDFGLVVE